MNDYQPTPMITGQLHMELVKTEDLVLLRERLRVAEQRLEHHKEQFREVYLEGMSLADWHTKHCAARRAALDLEKKLDKIRAYAEERKAYGKRGRTVHSSRIATDLLRILDGEV